MIKLQSVEALMSSGNARLSTGGKHPIIAIVFIFAFSAFAPPFLQPALAATTSDNFDRADGGLGANWTSLPDGGLVISSGQATGGAAGQYTGSYRSAEAFSPNQYSEVEITSAAFSSTTQQWIGPSVRNQANGDLYVGIYWNNLQGTPVLRVYKRVSGVWTQLGPEYVSGTLTVGAKLRLVALGTTVSLLLDGVTKISASDGDLSAGAPGMMAYDVPQVDNWSAGDFAPDTGATDNFDRADGSLGAGWTSLPDGGLILSSNQVFGAASGRLSGSMRTSEFYDGNQFSEIKTTTIQLSGNQWIGPSVRNQGNGDLYVGIYWWNNGAPLLRLYKRISGGFIQLGPDYTSGPLPAGTALKLTARGTTISFLQDGVERISVYDPSLDGGYPGIMAFDTPSADNWSGGTANFEAHFLGADANGVESYHMSSAYDGYGPRLLRVLRPTHPASAMAHNFLLALPVMEEGNTNFGDGTETLRSLNAQNNYNVTIIEPSFSIPPWYADNPLDPNYRFESFMTLELAPWVKTNLATTGSEKIWMIGFSKSGFGALDLIFKHPDIFTLAAAWDFPADMSTYTGFAADLNYGTEANFQNNYRLTSGFVGGHKTPFLTDKRIWIAGYNAFQTDLSDFDALLTSLGIQHDYPVPAFQTHSWDGGWVPGALAGLSEASAALSGDGNGSGPAITSANSTTFTVGSQGSFTVTTTGSPTPTLSEQGALPGGVTLTDHGNGTATLAGTPTSAGTYSFTITASNGVPPDATQNFTLTVNAAPTLSVTPGTLSFAYTIGGSAPGAQNASVTSSSSALSYTVSTSAPWLLATPANGTTPGSVSVAVSPAGLAAGTYNGAITVTATGAGNSPQTMPVTLTVIPAPTLSVTPNSLSFAYTLSGNTPAAQNVTASSSGSALSYAASTSAAWLSAAPASGTTPGSVSVSVNPAGLAAGTYSGTATITAAAAGNGPQTVAVSLTVNPAPPPLAILTASLPNGRVGQSYSAQLLATGGFPPYSWIVIDQNNFPQGLKLSSAGAISGKPSKAGTYTFTVQVTDSVSHSANRSFTVTIAPRR